MKSIIKHSLLACMAVVFLASTAHAQILIQTDGGVKIGSAPNSSFVIGNPSWQLSSQGLEVSIGDILFHTSKGKLRIDDFTTSKTIFSGSVSMTQTVNATAVTGQNLTFGTSSDYAFRVYADEIISTSSQKILSDRRYKENIEDLEDASAKVMQLRPVTFDFKKPENYTGDSLSLKGKVGFIAQEVQELFPNLVGYLPDADQYVLDYTSFIPYLTQTIQLQALQLEEQEERIADLEEMVRMLMENQSEVPARAPQAPGTGNEKGEGAMPQAKLYQNVPNPFAGTTEIRYELPEGVRSASIEVYEATGRMVKSRDLPATPGASSVSFENGEFGSGMYTYTLMVDNRQVDTKRMVVSE